MLIRLSYQISKFSIFSCSTTAPSWSGSPHYRGFTITFRHTTLGRTPLSEWSPWLRDNKTTLTTDRYPCLRRNSNQQSQQASSRRSMPSTARPLGSGHSSTVAKFIIRRKGSVGADVSTRHSYNPTEVPNTSWAMIQKILSLTVIYLCTHSLMHSFLLLLCSSYFLIIIFVFFSSS
jgi:hypothetical protein